MTDTNREEAIELDCGDNSCYFSKDKTGMRTNGGCCCFENAGFSRSAIKSAYDMLPKFLAEVASNRQHCERIRELEDRVTVVQEKHGIDIMQWARAWDDRGRELKALESKLAQAVESLKDIANGYGTSSFKGNDPDASETASNILKSIGIELDK